MNHSQKKDKLSRYIAKSQWDDWQLDVLVPCYLRKDANGIWQALVADTGGIALVLYATGYKQNVAVPSTGYMQKREQQLIAALTTYLENA